MSAEPNKWRVKVYKLDDEGSWADQGTGLVQCKYLSNLNAEALQVISDEGLTVGRVLLESEVSKDDIYQLQGKTIITWCDPLTRVDLALSFQEPRGCDEIWAKLCHIQGNVAGEYRARASFDGSGRLSRQEALHGEREDEFMSHNTHGREKIVDDPSQVVSGRSLAHADPSHQDYILLPPTRENLDSIANTLTEADPDARIYYAQLVLCPYREDESHEQQQQQHQSDNENDDDHPTNAQSECSQSEVKRDDKENNGPSASSPSMQDKTSDDSNSGSELKDTSYLARLLKLFRELEANNEVEYLHKLYGVIKAVALLNEPSVMQTMLSDEYFEDVVGALEYDPEVRVKPNHRKFLRENVKHKVVVPIADEQVLDKVHQNFRISFFRDVLLPRALDENSFVLLGDMDLANGVDIATSLHGHDQFLVNLFELLQSPTTSREKREEVIAFLQELCSLAKRMLVPSRHAFYRSLMEKSDNRLFEILEDILVDENASSNERLHVGEIIKLALEHDAELLRKHILNHGRHPKPPPEDCKHMVPYHEFATQAMESTTKETESKHTNESSRKVSIMAQLIRRMVFDPEPGMQAQACDVLRNILDPESMEVTEKDEFLGVFYEHYVQWLVYPLNFAGKPLEYRREKSTSSHANAMSGNQEDKYLLTFHRTTNSKKNDANAGSTSGVAAAISGGGKNGSVHLSTSLRKASETASVAEHHITELLSFCVQTHGYRIKYFVLRNNIVSNVLRLLRSRYKHLVLDAIRFVRTCVGLKDDFYNRFFVRNNLFSQLFVVFKENGPRNNLINSSIIELLEFIRMENIEVLITYIVETFGDILKDVDYVQTYKSLKQQYDNNKRFPRASIDESNNTFLPSSSNGPSRAFDEFRQEREDDDDAFYNEDESKDQDESPLKRPRIEGNEHRTNSKLRKLEETSNVADSSSSTAPSTPALEKFVPRSKFSLVPYDDDDEEEDDDTSNESKQNAKHDDENQNGKNSKLDRSSSATAMNGIMVGTPKPSDNNPSATKKKQDTPALTTSHHKRRKVGGSLQHAFDLL